MSIGLYSLNKSAVKKSASVDTHTSGGRGKEGREQGQPATTNNGETKDNTTKAENKQREHTTSRPNKERKGGKAGGRKHTRTQPWHAKEQAPPSTNRQQSKTAAAETTEAGQPPGGTNTHLSHGQEGRKGWGGLEEGEGRGERQKDRKEEGGVPSYACRVHGPTGEKKRGASSYNHVSRITPEVRGGGLKLSAGLDEVSNSGCKQPSQWSHMDLLNDVCTSSPGSMNLLFSG